MNLPGHGTVALCLAEFHAHGTTRVRRQRQAQDVVVAGLDGSKAEADGLAQVERPARLELQRRHASNVVPNERGPL